MTESEQVNQLIAEAQSKLQAARALAVTYANRATVAARDAADRSGEIRVDSSWQDDLRSAEQSRDAWHNVHRAIDAVMRVTDFPFYVAQDAIKEGWIK